MQKVKIKLLNWIMKHYLGLVVLDGTLEKRNDIIYRNGKPFDKASSAQITAEAEYLLKSRLWDDVCTHARSAAYETLLRKGTTTESLIAPRASLMTIEELNRILKRLAE